MPLHLDIVTPERLAYTDDVDEVIAPGSQGELGILPHHAPLLTTLGLSELRIRKGGTEESFAIVGGFLQVRPDRAVVMAETADMASEIDLLDLRAHEACGQRRAHDFKVAANLLSRNLASQLQPSNADLTRYGIPKIDQHKMPLPPENGVRVLFRRSVSTSQ